MKILEPWYWKSLSLKHLSGGKIFECLFSDHAIATLLESPSRDRLYPNSAQNKLCRYSICAGVPRLNKKGKYQIWTPSMGQIIPCLNNFSLQKTTVENSISHLPFTGGWLGWLSYDFAWEIESLPNINRDVLPFPVAYWYQPESFAVIDHQENILWLASSSQSSLKTLESQLEKKYSSVNFQFFNQQQSISNNLSFLSNQDEYQQAVRQALKYIKAGDVFQTNLSLRFHTTTNLDSWTIYRNLHQINPSPFASYWRSPWGVMVSCSPERLIQLEGNKAQTRPIAGTRPRGENAQEDQQLAQELLSNKKERAEHIMLIDLERNDLGKVCTWGSVEVDELLAIEKYSHVMHLVSNVKGKLKSDFNEIDLIAALFPGGTITGCPKVRCMEIIEELEPVKRNLFYGSCGYIDQRGNLDLNILIRTLLVTYEDNQPKRANVWGQVGAGIVADSNPEKEWFESLQKAQAQIVALGNS